MIKLYTLNLKSTDVGQILDGLDTRAESWEKTAEYLKTGASDSGDFFLIEECSDENEASGVAQHFRNIISEIKKQIKDQGGL